MELRLDGQVAVVTGAGNGIGRGVAVAMAEAGASVGLLDRSEPHLIAVEEAITSTGAAASAHRVDVSDPVAVERAVEAIAETLGDPTTLVTAAAIDGAVPLLDLGIEEWRQMLDVNLNGTFYCLKAVLPAMLRRGGGRVILFGSNVALKGGGEIAHYGTAKAGVHGLARCAAVDLAPHRITVNVIAPGPVETDMLASLPATWLEEKRAELLTANFATVEEIVPTVILLASDAGAFYTGSTINISGGDVLQ